MNLTTPHNLSRRAAAAQDARVCDDAEAALIAIAGCTASIRDTLDRIVALPFFVRSPELERRIVTMLNEAACELSTIGGFVCDATRLEAIEEWIEARHLKGVMDEVDDFFAPARLKAEQEIEEHGEVFDKRAEWGTW